MNKFFLLLITSLNLTSCFVNKSTFEQNESIQKLDIPLKIEYFNYTSNNTFDYSNPTFVITDYQELKSVINEIKSADNPEMWKGAGWNIIKLSYADTIFILNTNNQKIGTGSSGIFYDLEPKNFITNRLNE